MPTLREGRTKNNVRNGEERNEAARGRGGQGRRKVGAERADIELTNLILNDNNKADTHLWGCCVYGNPDA